MKKNRCGTLAGDSPVSAVCMLLVLVILGVSALPVLAETGETNATTGTEFNITPVLEEQWVMAIAITPPGSEQDVSDQMLPFNNTQITLTDPDGASIDVAVCAALDFSQTFTPEKPMYLVKRNKPNFFLVDDLTRGGCGGGGGGGSGTGGGTNKAITPEGTWTISITDVNKTPVYNGTFTI